MNGTLCCSLTMPPLMTGVGNVMLERKAIYY